jgi:hypothetical protein
MTATPMKLDDALRFNGFTIDQSDVAASTITLDGGATIEVPAMRLSGLTWQRAGDPEPWDSFYLEALPLFSDDYRPILLSSILDRFAGRRLSYDMPDEFGRAIRRWLNLNLGPMSELNRLYVSTTVALPLTTQDATIDSTTTNLSRDAHSDFPQGQLGGNLDYASEATDQAASGSSSVDYQGRIGESVMTLLAQQREAFLNVDTLVLDAMESLFLAVWDRTERDDELGSPSVGYIGSMFGDW